MISDIINDAEDVARVLFYPSFFHPNASPLFSQGVLSPTAFKLQILKSGEAESSISVLRTVIDTFNMDVARLTPRKPYDQKYGYALLNVGEIRNIKIPTLRQVVISVESSRSKRLKSHAEIILKIDGHIVTALDESMELIRFRKKLARIASSRIVKL